MKKRNYLKGRGFLLFSIIFMAFAASLLYACDTSNDDPPATEDKNPLIPDKSWDCGMPEGIPSAESGELVFEATMKLGNIYDMGQTPYGRRHLIEVEGGTVSGPDINATVLDGGLDYQLTLSNGAMEIDQVNILKTSDGSHIYFRNCGASADEDDVRIVPDFEAPNSSNYSFLNTGKFAGTRELDINAKTMTIKVYDVSNVTVDASAPGAVKVTQPEDVVDQSWECRQAGSSERKGDEHFTETVRIGSSISIGASKYGRRNIIPITGGTVSGEINGKVLSGGADYQLMSGGSFNLDARYTLQTNDGEMIIVRNCGPAASLVPVFETSLTSNYSYLNDQLWLSSSPGIRIGAVQITVFESID